MNLKVIIFAIFAAVVVGGVGFYWRSKQITPTPLVGEKQVEVIENPDGSKTFYNYHYNYKIQTPSSWDISFSQRIVSATTLRKKNALANQGIHISIVTRKGQTFDEYIEGRRRRRLRPSEDEIVTATPNITFAGVPAYKFARHGPDFPDDRIVTFERDGHWYSIGVTLDVENDPEYQAVLNSFEFLE